MLQPILALKHAVLKNMLDIASRANPNQGIRLPLPKQSRARTITMFKQQLCSLRDHLNVLSLFLSIVFSHWYLVRVPLWSVKLAWRVMHGRLATLMLILLSWATGLKNVHLQSGLWNKHYSDLFKWIQLTMVHILAKHFSRCATTSRLCQR